MIERQVNDGRSLEAYNELLLDFLDFYCDVVIDKHDMDSVRSVFPRQLLFKEKSGYMQFIEALMHKIEDSEVHQLTNLQKFVLYHMLMQIEEIIHESFDLVTERFRKTIDEDVEKSHLVLMEEIGYLLNDSFIDWDFLIQTDFSIDEEQKPDVQET